MILKDLIWDTAKQLFAQRLARVEGHLETRKVWEEARYAIATAIVLQKTWDNSDGLFHAVENGFDALLAEDAADPVYQATGEGEGVESKVGAAFMDFVCTKCRKKFGILWSDGVTEVQCAHCGTLVDISDDLEQIAAIRERMMEKKRGE